MYCVECRSLADGVRCSGSHSLTKDEEALARALFEAADVGSSGSLSIAEVRVTASRCCECLLIWRCSWLLTTKFMTTTVHIIHRACVDALLVLVGSAGTPCSQQSRARLGCCWTKHNATELVQRATGIEGVSHRHASTLWGVHRRPP